MPRSLSVRAKTQTDLIAISRKDFESILKTEVDKLSIEKKDIAVKYLP
jgi:CRP-like cAMP-binding protein